jgi:hypothetical protein
MGRECFMDMDYDKHDRPILPSLSDIVVSYTEDKAMQSTFDANDKTYINEVIQPKCLLNYQPLFPSQGPGTHPTADSTTSHHKARSLIQPKILTCSHQCWF